MVFTSVSLVKVDVQNSLTNMRTLRLEILLILSWRQNVPLLFHWVGLGKNSCLGQLSCDGFLLLDCILFSETENQEWSVAVSSEYNSITIQLHFCYAVSECQIRKEFRGKKIFGTVRPGGSMWRSNVHVDLSVSGKSWTLPCVIKSSVWVVSVLCKYLL